MAQVGRLYPTMFWRDWWYRNNGLRNLPAWRFRWRAGVPIPTNGPFADWNGSITISDEPVVDFSTATMRWNFQPPPGADPTSYMWVEYRLNNLPSWYDTKCEMGRQGTWYFRPQWGLLLGTNWSNPQMGWSQAEYNFQIPGMNGGWLFRGLMNAATWSELGVTQYPGHP